jgi:hypothetical protein
LAAGSNCRARVGRIVPLLPVDVHYAQFLHELAGDAAGKSY